MTLEKQEEKALKRFQEILAQKFGQKVSEISLFGSKARGESHAKSDIDILVVTQQEDWHLKEQIGKWPLKFF